MELELRNPGTKTFIDCDDLTDLTRLFSYVGQDWRGWNMVKYGEMQPKVPNVLRIANHFFGMHFSKVCDTETLSGNLLAYS